MKKLLCIAVFVCAAGFSARGQAILNPSNTVVRLTISTGGGSFGNIDIELFDQDKPETVRNFLIYVYSGMYSNLVLNRLDPDFVMQSGRLRVPNPSSTNQFTSYLETGKLGAITNEYSVGPQLSNVFGTIAMARSGGITNSAETEWFFNLTNNAFLNDVDGGFTVFGHVVNTTNARSGTNLLNYFNTLTANTAVTTDPLEYFSELPISTNRFAVVTNRMVVTNITYVTNMTVVMTNRMVATNVTYVTNALPIQVRDLFTVVPSFLHGRARDTSAPSVSVSDTNAVIRTTNSSITLSGRAGDNMEVARVQYESDAGIFLADGKTNWAVTNLPLTPGTNLFFVRSIDYFGNFSPTVQRTIFYSVPRRVTLELTGNGVGKVTGITNGQMLELGVNYNLIAKPKAGHYFNGWRGSVFSRSRAIYFTMSEQGTNIIARFTTTLLGLAKGTYQGVFFPGGSGPPRSAGFISLNLSGNGAYSGQLRPIGASYPIHGQFDANGGSVITGQQGTNALALFMGLQTEGAEGISGTYTDGAHATAAVQLWRVQSYAGTNSAPAAGRYTFNITPPTGTNAVSDGSGFGTMTVDALGRVALSGELGDGEAFTEKAAKKFKPALLKGNRFAFYAPAYQGRGGVLGLATLESNNTFTASGKWFGPNFPSQNGQAVRILGSPYTPPPARVFEWTNGIVTLSGDGLTNTLQSEIMFETNGTLTVLANTNNVQLQVAPGTGLITGTFAHPTSNVLTALRGAVLQGSNSAAGYFPGPLRNGSFILRPAP